MASNPQLVNADCTITWDGVSQRIPRGTVIDVPAGSALATALGSNITALTTQQKSSNGGSSLGPFLENLTGGGNEPSNWGQV
jgi:hypothetical protein